MYRAFCLLLFMAATVTVRAQGFFNQKGELIKKYIEQIGLLRTYYRQAKEGYRIVDKGLTTIHDIKNGEFGLHDLYYRSLKKVNPNIRRLSKVDAAIETGSAIFKTAGHALSNSKTSLWLSTPEKSYVGNVLENLLRKTDDDLSQLERLVTDDSLQLTDDERIERIDKVYTALVSKSAFLQQFTSALQVLVTSRSKGFEDQRQVRQLFNLKNETP